MKIKGQSWIRHSIILVTLGLLTWFAPSLPIDPWDILSPKKIISMIFTLAIIQILGSVLAKYLGTRTGAILTGFFGGLISSTATTAALARRSKMDQKDLDTSEVLTFLAATGAMLFEGLVLVIIGTTKVHISNLMIFIGPILATLVMIYIQYKKQKNLNAVSTDSSFSILSLLKLSVFIILILAVSKVFQNIFGNNGLLVITSLVSLFEIHGSVISNVQLHELGGMSEFFLSSLLAVSVISSYLSKLFLIWTLGSVPLRSIAIKCTFFLFSSLAVSWVISILL